MLQIFGSEPVLNSQIFSKLEEKELLKISEKKEMERIEACINNKIIVSLQSENWHEDKVGIIVGVVKDILKLRRIDENGFFYAEEEVSVAEIEIFEIKRVKC